MKELFSKKIFFIQHVGENILESLVRIPKRRWEMAIILHISIFHCAPSRNSYVYTRTVQRFKGFRGQSITGNIS